jgi:hypothetical protein
MSKIAEQIRKIQDEQGQSKTVAQAQVDALLAGKGRVEYLVTLADEYGMELRLERKARKRDGRDA